MCFQQLLLKAGLCAKSFASASRGTFAKDNILEYAGMPNKGIFICAHMLYLVELWAYSD